MPNPWKESLLERTMAGIGYHLRKTVEHLLPNGKKLEQIDFGR